MRCVVTTCCARAACRTSASGPSARSAPTSPCAPALLLQLRPMDAYRRVYSVVEGEEVAMARQTFSRSGLLAGVLAFVLMAGTAAAQTITQTDIQRLQDNIYRVSSD